MENTVYSDENQGRKRSVGVMSMMDVQELETFTDVAVAEFFDLCILIETFTAEDYVPFYEEFWQTFSKYVKDENRNTSEMLMLKERAYDNLFSEIKRRFREPVFDSVVGASLSDRPHSVEKMHSLISKLRDRAGGGANGSTTL